MPNRSKKKPVRRAKYEAGMTPFWIAWELVTCGLMLGCIALWFVYATKLVQEGVFKTRFDVYDADAFTSARYLLPRRTGSSVNGSR